MTTPFPGLKVWPMRAAIADLFPLDPPEDWFTTIPDWFQPNMKFTVMTEGPEAGRVAATVAQRGTFILNGGAPWSAPDSPTGYADSMQGDTPVAGGNIIKTANLSADLNHVPASATFGQAVDAMAHTGAQLARVRYVDVPGYGTVALGAMWPEISDLQVRKAQASALSGDWRWREEYDAYDMTGAIFVNNPGLPLPARPVFQPFAMAASLSSGQPNLHPPIVGSWQHPQEYSPVETNQIVTCGGCGNPMPVGTSHMCVARPAQVAAAPVAAAPGDPAIPSDPAPAGGDLEARVAAVEDRLDAVEGWLSENAMAEMEAMPAALPEPEEAPATA